MDLQLADKTAIVTGGAQGIGQAIVLTLAAEGARVVIADRNESATNEVVDQIRQAGGQAVAAIADLTNVDECRQVVASTNEQLGGIDILVNNAGFNDGCGLDRSPDEFMSSVRSSLLHVYALTHFSLPSLKASRGCIVNISSKVSFTGQGHTSGYAAAKGAINALTREWALELAADQVRVNCVIPAECQSAQYENFFQSTPDPEATRTAIGRLVPLENRLTEAEEIASTVAFVASPMASHTTGQLLFVDGGYTHLDRAISHDHEKWT